MSRYVVGLEQTDRTQVARVGGKAAHLGELSRLDGIRVPAGCCVTTEAFRRMTSEAPSVAALLDTLSQVRPDDRDAIRTISAHVRKTIEAVAIPSDVAGAVSRRLAQLGDHAAYAVRSSATAEDLPSASFAGQQDTYLNVVGAAAILQHVSRCWASLFTERAVTYRLRSGIAHRHVSMAVVIQLMVLSEAAGVLFTADPVTCNRKVASVEASFGLGETLASGRVTPDVYKVRGEEVVERAISAKRLAIHAVAAGGTQEQAVARERQQQRALSDAQVVELASLGRLIEAHFGYPQDIEWCLADGALFVVQSRPITTLFPIPPAGDDTNRVYVSVGHQQMMTDPMKPLGLSMWQLTTPRPMSIAGGRLFVDVTQILAAPASRASLLELFGKGDPLLRDALETVIERDDFLPAPPEGAGAAPAAALPTSAASRAPIEPDPARVTELVAETQQSLAHLRHDIRGRSGPELFEFILADLQELRRLLMEPGSHQTFMAAMDAAWWLNEQLEAWLGEKNAADKLSQSVPNNVTSEMGLALLDVADVIRAHPRLVEFLEQVGDDDSFLDELATMEGGAEARDAIEGYLERFGMRGTGEVDITRPRWSERPSTLVPLMLGNVRSFEPGAGKRRFEQGAAEAREQERQLLERLRALPDGEQKAREAKRRIDLVRTFMGYREYPKYGMVSRYFIYKQALLREAERLVGAGVLRDREEIFYLTFEELHEVARTNQVDHRLIREREQAFRSYAALTPPRVLTSEGECLMGSHRRDDLPADALVGLPASAGTVEGRARVVLDLADADLEAGDILVTAYTDPSWTPAFVTASGLVTEVGGLMTHGSVIAREYGLPAIVGVDNATRRIRDGQRIRLHATEGYIEIVDSEPQ
ncbi:MAG: rifamycin-inactivating phosphotransferase [Gaiellales bacterium]